MITGLGVDTKGWKAAAFVEIPKHCSHLDLLRPQLSFSLLLVTKISLNQREKGISEGAKGILGFELKGDDMMRAKWTVEGACGRGTELGDAIPGFVFCEERCVD